ncbi:serine/threonine protein kinase [Candidatus Magnetoovum chiemensis]|nr:serine/threonine protein kinase [Candidatus Magnetoovum chiemensis]
MKRRKYPELAIINGEIYKFERILKDDFFSINVLYHNAQRKDRYVLKISDFRFIGGFLLKPLARFFSLREYKIYQTLEGIRGIPACGPRFGKRGFFHFYVEGRTLHELGSSYKLPDDFFVNLKAIIDELHNRRIFYLDLNKSGNIILGDDNNPYLVDFQISIPFKNYRGIVGKAADAIFNALKGEDIYHIYKHKKRLQPHLITKEEMILAKRTKLNTLYDRIWGRPYRKVKRLIYPSGSNEIIWYKWKRMKDKSKRMP